MLMNSRNKGDKGIPEESVFKINENLLNIIQPSSVEFDTRSTALGENVGKIYAISRYPYTSDYGWLAPLCNLEGTATTIEFKYTDSANLISIFNASIKEKRGNLGTIRSESEKQVTEKEIRDLEKLINRLSIKQEPVGYLNIMLHIQDTNEKALRDRIKRVSGVVAVQGCNLKLLTKRQGKALKAIAPYGMPDPDVSNMGLRNMPISSFIGGFPMANPGLNDKSGYFLGKTSNGRLVICNPWLRGKDRTNTNWFISGIPGTGKSTTLKDILMTEYALGTKIIVFDPNEEFIELSLAPDISGDVIYCAGEFPKMGKQGRINPLQARKMAVIKEDDLEKSEKKEDFIIFEDDSSELALHIQHLKTFFQLYFGKEEYTAGIRAILEECLIELYQDFGITWETDISKIPNEEWPVMKDLFQKVDGRKKCTDKELSEYKKTNYEKLHDLLFSVGKGADRLWNGPTTLESRADFVDLVVSGLNETDEKVKRAQYYNVLSWCNEAATADRNQKVLVAVDEGYLLVDPDYPDIMKYMRNMSKQFRKYEAGLMFITHSVVDVLDPAVKRFGQAIIDNACYKFIMGCDGKNLKETQELLNLTENEINILSQKNRGQGIFFAGNTRLDLTVDVSDDFLAMMGTAGGR